MEFKDRIKYLRVKKELSHAHLAIQFGKTESAVRSWELGRSKPDVDTLIKLSEYFDVSTDYLLGKSEFTGIESYKASVEFMEAFTERMKKIHQNDAERFLKILIKCLDSFDSCHLLDEPDENKIFYSLFHLFASLNSMCSSAALLIESIDKMDIKINENSIISDSDITSLIQFVGSRNSFGNPFITVHDVLLRMILNSIEDSEKREMLTKLFII